MFPKGVHCHGSQHCDGDKDCGNAAQHRQPGQLFEGWYEHQRRCGHCACHNREIEGSETQYETCASTSSSPVCIFPKSSLSPHIAHLLGMTTSPTEMPKIAQSEWIVGPPEQVRTGRPVRTRKGSGNASGGHHDPLGIGPVTRAILPPA